MASDTAKAGDVDARLAAMTGKYLRGANTLWRSRIAAVRSECSLAIEPLRTAFNAGAVRDSYAHHYYAALGRARECRGLRDALAPRD